MLDLFIRIRVFACSIHIPTLNPYNLHSDIHLCFMGGLVFILQNDRKSEKAENSISHIAIIKKNSGFFPLGA